MIKTYCIEKIKKGSCPGIFLGILKKCPRELGVVGYASAIKFADKESAEKMLGFYYELKNDNWIVTEHIEDSPATIPDTGEMVKLNTEMLAMLKVCMDYWYHRADKDEMYEVADKYKDLIARAEVTK